MRHDVGDADLESRRRAVRRRALANLILVLLEESRRTAGRLAVRSFARDAVLLEYRDVRTLVRRNGVCALETRDFTVVLGCPRLWPFDRGEPVQPFILAPDDFAHPNSNGRGMCLDLEGVLPERIPSLLYDNLRVRLFRLDHRVDSGAADFVRAHLGEFPADPRLLYCPLEVAR